MSYYQLDPLSIIKKYSPKKSFYEYDDNIQQKVKLLKNSKVGDKFNFSSEKVSTLTRQTINRLAFLQGVRHCFIPNKEEKLKKNCSSLIVSNIPIHVYNMYSSYNYFDMNSAYHREFQKIVKAVLELEKNSKHMDVLELKKFQQNVLDIEREKNIENKTFIPSSNDIEITIKTIQFFLERCI